MTNCLVMYKKPPGTTSLEVYDPATTAHGLMEWVSLTITVETAAASLSFFFFFFSSTKLKLSLWMFWRRMPKDVSLKGKQGRKASQERPEVLALAS